MPEPTVPRGLRCAALRAALRLNVAQVDADLRVPGAEEVK